jgi:DNA-binding Lrp family transcriptional regulator
MAQTYILLDTIPGSVREVAEMLRKLEYVRTVDMVVGPHDIIAVLDTPDMDTLGDLLAEQVRTIPGVIRTTTCITMSS